MWSHNSAAESSKFFHSLSLNVRNISCSTHAKTTFDLSSRVHERHFGHCSSFLCYAVSESSKICSFLMIKVGRVLWRNDAENWQWWNFLDSVCFSEEAEFHLDGNVNRRNYRIWGSQTLHANTEKQREPEIATLTVGLFVNMRWKIE